jgi:hypothetical protein
MDQAVFPDRDGTLDGPEASRVPAIVARFESVTGSARLEVVLARDTLALIGVHGAPISARSNRLSHT